MNPIKSFSLTGMSVSGFKCFADKAEIPFFPVTQVTGGNGRGKSSVADAIAFAVTGLPFFGERGVDRLHSERNPDLSVTLRFTDENGDAHELIRNRQKSRCALLYDGREIRQSDLSVMFGEKDVFLSILNPLYFIEELGDDGKKLLERYLPDVSQEDVMAALPAETRDALQGESLLQPDVWLKNRRAEIKDLRESVIYLTGQKDHAAAQREQGSESMRALVAKLEALRGEASELESRQFNGVDLADVERQLTELGVRHSEMSAEAPETADTADLDRRIRELESEQAKQDCSQYAPQFTDKIAAANADAESLLGRYKRERAALNGFQPGTICPTCHRAVTEEELPAVQSELQKFMSEVVKQGKAARAHWNQLRREEAEAEKAFYDAAAQESERLRGEIQELKRQRDEKIAAVAERNRQHAGQVEELLSQIHNLSATKECGALGADEYERLKVRREEIRDCQARLDAAHGVLDTAQEDYDAQIRDIERQIRDKEEQMKLVVSFAAKKAELLFANLKMNRVAISLYDVVKSTGEAKEAFRFTYDGRLYNRLSLSEKVRAGMEVSELMKRLTGRNYPQFVDNMESVDDLKNVHPSGQVIMAKCVRNTELSVRSAGSENRERQAAQEAA